MDTRLGLGNATGMFYHAPAGTELPASASTAPGAAWTKVGDVTADGISLNLDKSTSVLRNWALTAKRVIESEHTESISSPLMDTTPEVLKTVCGTAAVTATSASMTVDLSKGLPPEEAYLWLMKDGDDMMALGCTHGQITAVAGVNFAPNGAIVWTPTITVLQDSLKLIADL